MDEIEENLQIVFDEAASRATKKKRSTMMMLSDNYDNYTETRITKEDFDREARPLGTRCPAELVAAAQ